MNLYLRLMKLDSKFATGACIPPPCGPSAYDCVIPVDVLIARGDYEHEFTLHQFTILAGGAAQKFEITQFDKIRIA